jgi:serine/threonine protein kinase/tetratricopeptide (TPR) repeat protein
MICPKCLSENPEDVRACVRCGTPLPAAFPGRSGDTKVYDTQTLPPPDRDFMPGTVIADKYKLLEELGRGGMGSVFKAEQVHPIHREVALKIIKLGMDTARVVARFEAERQALAVMDHPNIATVYDAGVTEKGRPFFVMELVHGIRLDEYCDKHKLTVRDRLELFIAVCHAVQHAHQKGVIHRDLKPSNILVTVQDDKPLPKVIDFGIAKATGPSLTERTLFTEQGQLIGTPEYMSPEQAEMTALDVDTRTDIYSLGVMLYGLLVGRLPFEPETLRSAGPAEVQRIIRDTDPLRPSTRLGTMGTDGLTVAERMRTDPAALRRDLKGDLDWIIMKALEKDRTRRYATASEMAADIERHLRHEPVTAGPPGTAYRLRKYVRRHRLGVAAGGIVLLAVLAGITGTTIGLYKATKAEKKAVEEAQTALQVSEFLVNLFKVSDPGEARGNSITAREILDKGATKIEKDLAGQPIIQSRIMETIGQVFQNLGLFKQAEPLLVKSIEIRKKAVGEDHYYVGAGMINLAWLYLAERRISEAEPLVRHGLKILEARLPGETWELARGLLMLGMIHRDRGELVEAQKDLERSLAICERTLGPDHERVSYPLYHLGWLHKLKGEFEKARDYYQRALTIMERELGPTHPSVLWCRNDLAVVTENIDDYETAEGLYRQVLTVGEKVWGPEHPYLANPLNNLGVLYWRVGQYAKAESCYNRALAIREKAFGPDHPNVGDTLNNIALIYQETGEYDLAKRTLERALAINEKAGGPESVNVLHCLNNLAIVDFFQGNYGAAESLFQRALAASEKILGPGHPDIAGLLLDYAGMLRVTGEFARSEAFYERALAIKEKTYGPETIGPAICLMNLAKVYAAWGQPDKADSFYRRSLEIYEKVQSPDKARTPYAQATYWAVAGDKDAALKYLKRAIELGYKRAFFNDPDLASLRGNPEFKALVLRGRAKLSH